MATYFTTMQHVPGLNQKEYQKFPMLFLETSRLCEFRRINASGDPILHNETSL